MPVYEYKCGSCGHVFEVIQKFSDEPLKIHENCGGALERLISPPALQFKGTGWYVTDYGKGNSKEVKPKTDSNGKSGDETKKPASDSSSPAKSTSTSDSASTAKPTAAKSKD